jgi:hypothetical protein
MMKIEDRLDHVGKRAMTQVVEKGSRSDRDSFLAGDLIGRTEPVKNSRCQMECPERVSETRVFGALIGKVTKSELPYAPKPLELRRVYQLDQQPAFSVVSIDPYYIMYGIPVDPFCQISPPESLLAILPNGAQNSGPRMSSAMSQFIRRKSKYLE